MPLNITRAPSALKKDGSEGRILANQIYVGIVKDNSDAQRMGRLRVWVPEFGGAPSDEASWITVSYASPFAGVSNPAQLAGPQDGGDEYLKMAGTQKSYGWWAIPPDVENHVLVCFASGDLARGFYFACIYQQYMNHMVPGIPLNRSTDDTLNETVLPVVCEYNKKDPKIDIKDPKRPVYEPLHNGLTEQGLYADPERGASITGARRMEDRTLAPVYGLLTPGGNTINIDEDPQNEFIRLRTKSGVQVLIHETTGYVYMNSKLGNSWMEISDEGINMYSKFDISIRAEGSINMHADGSVATQGGAVHTRGGNVTTRAEGQLSTESGGNTVRQGGNILDNPANADGSPQYASLGDSATSGTGSTDSGGGAVIAGGTPSSKGFVAPVEGIGGSQFGEDRGDHMHAGVDIRGVPIGTPVVSSQGGKVLRAQRNGAYGNMVEVDHGNGVITRYGHLNSINVSPGQTVAQGQLLGGLGSTGRSTGPHLHYEVRVNGTAVNPNSYHDNAFLRGNKITRGIDPLFETDAADALRPVSTDELALLLRHGRQVEAPAAGDLVVLRDQTVAVFRGRAAGRFHIAPVDGATERAVSASEIMAFRRVPMALGPWLDLLRDADDAPCPCCEPLRTRGVLDPESTTSAAAQKLAATTPPAPAEQPDVTGSGGGYTFSTTSTIAGVLPSHEPWTGHPMASKLDRAGLSAGGGSTSQTMAMSGLPPANNSAFDPSAVDTGGIDPNYFKAMEQIESHGNPNAVSSTGCAGLFQFSRGTGKQYGLVGPGYDYRTDPAKSYQAVIRLTQDNASALQRAGLPVTPEYLYLAHQQGSGGATSIASAAMGRGSLSPKILSNMSENMTPTMRRNVLNGAGSLEQAVAMHGDQAVAQAFLDGWLTRFRREYARFGGGVAPERGDPGTTAVAQAAPSTTPGSTASAPPVSTNPTKA